MNATERRELAEYAQRVIGRSAESLARGSNVWRHSLADYAPAYLDALESEQDRRCVSDLDTAHADAIEENAERFTGQDHPDYHRMDALPKLTQHEREA